jgi:hypothetical protein
MVNHPFDRGHGVSGFEEALRNGTLGDGLVGSSDTRCAAGFRWRRGAAFPRLNPKWRLVCSAFRGSRPGSQRRILS